MAAERGYGDLVGIIIDKTRASPAYNGIMGRTALHAAVISENLEMTEKLMVWKPDLIKEVDENEWSPLHCAAYLGCTKIVQQLLDKSLDKSVTYLAIKDGKKTALHLAASQGNIKTVYLLLSVSPDCCEQVDDQGNNVLHFAAKRNMFPSWLSLNDLLGVRGLLNEKDAKGDTPLHLIASNQIYDPDFLKDNRVDKMALNGHKLTALDILSRANINRRDAYRVQLLRQMEEWKKVARLFSWPEAINKDTGSSSESEEEKLISNTKREGEAHLIVAALVATVTFAAGFTLPGGYNDEDGTAILTKKAAFKAFVVTDTIAVTLSVSAVFVYFFMFVHQDEILLYKHQEMGSNLTMFSVGAMVVAFMTGLYAVLPLSSGLPIVVCIICSFFLIAFYFVWRQIAEFALKMIFSK